MCLLYCHTFRLFVHVVVVVFTAIFSTRNMGHVSVLSTVIDRVVHTHTHTPYTSALSPSIRNENETERKKDHEITFANLVRFHLEYFLPFPSRSMLVASAYGQCF